MKNFLILAFVLTFGAAQVAMADGYDLTVKSISEFGTSTAAPATGDLYLIWDASANTFVKQSAIDLKFVAITASGLITGDDVTAVDDVTAGDDLVVTDDATVTDDLLVSGDAVVTLTTTLNGDVIGDGGDQVYGFGVNQVASTTTSVTLAQCGSHFISNSADVMTLPEASTVLGCRYTFTCGTADDFDINPADGTDQISPVSTTNGTTGVVTLAPSAGDAIRCTDIGGSITLEAIAADRWAQVAGGNGIWTDVN
jgi:hypothetical protein